MLGAFRDMELTLDEAELVESHLSACAGCRAELEEIEKVVAALQSLSEVPVKDFADAIETRINQRLALEAAEQKPILSIVPNNVRALPARSSSSRSVWAAAAILLVGFVAAATLAPRPAVEVAQVNLPVQSSHTASVAYDPVHRGPARSAAKAAGPQAEDMVALYDEESTNNVTDVGISTNEDGLYAIKM